jgi:hypothetical protein
MLAAAAALALSIGGAALHLRHRETSVTPVSIVEASAGTVHVRAGGRDQVVAAPAPVVPGDHVVAEHGGAASLKLRTGTLLTVTDGELAVVEQDARQVFWLDRGAVRADVAKLHEGERFLIRTGDAEVEVRGTSFVVERMESDGPCVAAGHTRVTVYEGVVTVRAHGEESKVAAGEQWPSDCGVQGTMDTANSPVPSSVSATAAPATPVASPSGGGPGSQTPNRVSHSAGLTGAEASTARSGPPMAETPSALRLQNAVFAEGLAAKRRGDVSGAAKIFEDFLNRFPSSPLCENAMVERMRMLSGDQAVEAARNYLSTYPQGYARTEALGMADRSP